MRTSLQIILIILFSLNLISCKSEDTDKVNEPMSKGGDALGDVLDPIGDGLNDAGDGLNDGLNDLTGGGSGGSESGSDEDVPIIHTKFIKKITPGIAGVYGCYLGADIKQTDDGGYIVAGCHAEKAWRMKTDVYGKKQWEKTYSLGVYIPHFLLTPWSVIQTSDGGYLLASQKGYLKTDSSGKMLWKKKGVPGKPAQNRYYEDVIEHSNGNYYLVGGPVEAQAIMVKISPTGSVLQTKFYGGSCADDIFRSVIESNDGKLIMVGEKTHGNGPYPCSFYFRYWKDIWVVKTGKNGGKIWDKTYGGIYLEKGQDIVRTTDSDGYIVLGQKCGHGGRIMDCGSVYKAVILKINEEGNQLNENFLPLQKMFEYGRAQALATTHLGGYVFVTASVPRPNKTEGKLWIKKWGSGEKNMELKIWTNSDGGRSIMRTNDNGFIISDGEYMIKTDSNLSYE